jgi:hypothetical protein
VGTNAKTTTRAGGTMASNAQQLTEEYAAATRAQNPAN